MQSIQFSAQGISVCVDLSVGHIADLIVTYGDRIFRPLHRAPWVDGDSKDLPEGISAGLARLSGDFLCAPFSANDIEPAPGHGWPGNSDWDVLSNHAIECGWSALLQLRRKVLGATITKRLTLRDNHPFLYQEHQIIGGSGELPVAHHPMSVMADGGLLSFSPKRVALTPANSLEPDPARGRYMLAYPARTTDLKHFPSKDGGTMNLTSYRDADRREDFVILVEADHAGPGWTALARRAERDLVLVMKNPRELPTTMLWFSNGGRDYAPWNGRHRGVLGIEDGRTAVGHAQSVGDNDLKHKGVATSFVLRPDAAIAFRHVIGSAPSNGERPPTEVISGGGAALLKFAEGPAIELPFDSDFLQT